MRNRFAGFVVFCLALPTEQANQELIARHGNDGIIILEQLNQKETVAAKAIWFQAMFFPTQDKINVAVLELRRMIGIYRSNRRFDLAAMSKCFVKATEKADYVPEWKLRLAED